MTDRLDPEHSGSRWTRLGPALAIATAVVATIAWQAQRPEPTPERDHDLPAVSVTSDAPRYGSLRELADASELVVHAQVSDTRRGRVFGDPALTTAIESRVVTLQVTRIIRGEGVTAGALVLVEEEGWTADGAPLVVDGAHPSEPGDDAIWFLLRVGSAEEQRYVAVNAQGRYVVDGDRLVGASAGDPLVAELEALGASGLEAAVAALT